MGRPGETVGTGDSGHGVGGMGAGRPGETVGMGERGKWGKWEQGGQGDRGDRGIGDAAPPA